jgi:hypothetical protein
MREIMAYLKEFKSTITKFEITESKTEDGPVYWIFHTTKGTIKISALSVGNINTFCNKYRKYTGCSFKHIDKKIWDDFLDLIAEEYSEKPNRLTSRGPIQQTKRWAWWAKVKDKIVFYSPNFWGDKEPIKNSKDLAYYGDAKKWLCTDGIAFKQGNGFIGIEGKFEYDNAFYTRFGNTIIEADLETFKKNYPSEILIETRFIL